MSDSSVDQQVVSRFVELCAEGHVATVEEFCSTLSKESQVESETDSTIQNLSVPTIIALVQAEIEARRSRGEAVEFEDFQTRFPMLEQDSLRDLIELPTFAPPVDHEKEGMFPSRYQRLGALGSGGLGEVWKVWDSQMRREVAIKTIRQQHRLNHVVNQRLEREALITGAIQHPGIPAIHGFGRLADGSVHVVMKQVEGTTLAEILAQSKAEGKEIPKLVNIFAQVAKTLAFAHSQGFVHRDLKPQNIMVGRFGEVQVMDWGMAKRIGQAEDSLQPHDTGTSEVNGKQSNDSQTPHLASTESVEESVLTREGDVFGTPAYMAPEQAGGKQDQVGPSSDVFSLGAILFEILCGNRLHQAKGAQNMIELASEGVTEASLNELRGCHADEKLREVCTQCLRFAPDERPANAAAVSDAIMSYVDGAQVALEQERLDRKAAEVMAVEATKRRKSTLWFSSGIVAAAMLGTVGVLWQWNVAAVARDDAKFQGSLAQERFLQAKQTVDQYLVEVADSRSLLSATPGTQALRRTLLGMAKDYYKAFTATKPDSIELRVELANAYQSLGKIARELQSNDETIEVLNEAIRIRTDVIADGYQVSRQSLELMRTNNELAFAYDILGDAEATIRACKAVQEIAANVDDTLRVESDLEIAKAMNAWGTALSRLGQDRQAKAKQRESVDFLKNLGEAHQDDPAIQLVYAESLRRLAVSDTQDNNRKDARESLEEALDVLTEATQDADPTSTSWGAYGSICNALAQVYWDDGDASLAIELTQRACGRLEQVVVQNPLIAEPIRILGNSYNGLGFYLTATSDDKAIEVFDKSIPMLERAVTNRPQDLELMRELAESYAMRGEYFLQERESPKALADIEQALAINERRRSLAPENRDIVDLLIEGHKSRGILLRRTGRPEEAAEAYREGISLIENLEQEGRVSRETLRSKAGITNNLAYLYQSERKFEESLEPYEQAAAMYEELAEGDVVRIEYYYHASSLTNKGSVLLQMGRDREAGEYLDRSIAMLESARGERADNRMLMQYLFESYVYRSDLLDRSQDYSGAQRDLEAALALDENPFSDVARLKLLAVRVALGEIEESLDSAAKLLDGKPSDFWAEASRIPARAATITLDRQDLTNEEREEEVRRLASIAAKQIERAMEMNRFMFLNSGIIPRIPEHKELWDRPEYERVRTFFAED